MDSILQALKEKKITAESIPERFRKVQATEVQTFVEALLASDLEEKLDISHQIIVESGEEVKKMTKIYNKKVLAMKKEEKKAADEADEEDDTLCQIQPKLTRTLYTKVISSKINAKHAFFGTHEIPCRHNIYYYFGFQREDAAATAHPTEYSKIRCSYETNNYIQVTYNEETKNTSVLVPEKAYLEAMMEHNVAEEKMYTFIPINVGFTKKAKVTHACLLIIENENRTAYFFDPNGLSPPDNDTVDGHYQAICEDYDLTYQRTVTWNPGNVSLQFNRPYRENFNDGDCFVLAVHFAKLLQETKTTPRRLLADLHRMETKKRKCLINKFYAEFAAYIPKRKVAPRKKKGEAPPAPVPQKRVPIPTPLPEPVVEEVDEEEVDEEEVDEEDEEEDVKPVVKKETHPKPSARPAPRVIADVSEDDDYED